MAEAWRSLGRRRLQRRRWRGGAGHTGLQLDRGVEDGQGVEAVTRWLDQTGAGVTGLPGCGGARGGTDCSGGSGVEEPATPGYS
jgi:hypothetical protein